MLDNGPIVIEPKTGSNIITLEAGATSYSGKYMLIDLSVFALEYKVACTGLPNVKLEIEQSSDGENWYTPDNISELVSSITDKNQHGIQLSPITVACLRIKATELTTTVTDTVVTVKLSAQKRFSA